MADASQIRLGPEEQAGVAEAERLVREAEVGARELGGGGFWRGGGDAPPLPGPPALDPPDLCDGPLLSLLPDLQAGAPAAPTLVRPDPGRTRRQRRALRH